MFTAPSVIAGLLLIMAAVQLALAIYLVRLLRPRSTPLDDAAPFSPHVAVLITLRGCDPDLENSLTHLLELEYKSYEVQVVVDHESDPAWKLVNKVTTEHPNANRMHVQLMSPPVDTCSLKCHSLTQAVGNVSERTEVIVLVDADVTPHPKWLHDVVAPLNDPEVGVVTGNQWYEPQSENTGTLLRSMWNAGAMVPTVIFRNPWAGTCAMRLKDVVQSGLVESWQNSVVDDGPIRESMDKLRLKIHFEPKLMMVNHDDCSTGYVNGYITRMLTWSRLFESTFINTLIHASFSLLLLLACDVFLIVSVVRGDMAGVAWLAGALVVFCVGSTIGYSIVRSGVNRTCKLRGSGLAPLSIPRLLNLTLLAPVIQLIYAASCFRAAFTKQIEWRKIRYQIDGKNVRMLGYGPFAGDDQKSTGPDASGHSI